MDLREEEEGHIGDEEAPEVVAGWKEEMTIMDTIEVGTAREAEGRHIEEDTAIDRTDPLTVSFKFKVLRTRFGRAVRLLLIYFCLQETTIEIGIMITMKIDTVMMTDIILTNMVTSEEEITENSSHRNPRETTDLASMGLLS